MFSWLGRNTKGRTKRLDGGLNEYKNNCKLSCIYMIEGIENTDFVKLYINSTEEITIKWINDSLLIFDSDVVWNEIIVNNNSTVFLYIYYFIYGI